MVSIRSNPFQTIFRKIYSLNVYKIKNRSERCLGVGAVLMLSLVELRGELGTSSYCFARRRTGKLAAIRLSDDDDGVRLNLPESTPVQTSPVHPRDVRGDRNCTHPHPSPWNSFHPHPSPLSFIPIPTRPGIILSPSPPIPAVNSFHPHFIPAVTDIS